MHRKTRHRRIIQIAAIGVVALVGISTAHAQVISEFLSDDDGGGEFIEIYNNQPVTLDLSGYTVSDEETIGAGEGAFSFPPGTSLASGGVIVTTNNATTLAASSYPALPGAQVFEWADSDGDPSNDLVKNSSLATGTITLSNSGDEILLYDPTDTLIDGVAYGSKSLPPYPTVGRVGKELSAIRLNLDRQPALETDWSIDNVPTPGAVPFVPPVATCTPNPCGPNEDCDDSSGSVVCSCANGYVEDSLGVCVEDCATAGCLLTDQVCSDVTGLCECGPETTDYGNGVCTPAAGVVCEEGSLGYGYLGQAGDDTIPNGGCLTDNLADLDDAGLSAVFDALAASADPQAGETFDPPLVVSGAIVAATNDSGGKQRFYLQDSSGTIATSLSGAEQPPFDLRVGQKVSFEVTEVELYFSNPQISGAQNWALESDENLVAAPTATAPLTEADAASMVHLVGVATTPLDDSTVACGTDECFVIESADGVSVVVTAPAGDLTLGSTVEVVGPIEWRGDLANPRINLKSGPALANPFWGTYTDPVCTISDDCGPDADCVAYNCVCTGDGFCGTGGLCQTGVCVCDADNLYVDDGAGGCMQVDCIDADDCAIVGQLCNANACECPAGDVIENGECVTPTADECNDVDLPCLGDGEVCDTTPSVNICVCDSDNLYIDDGVGGCIQVDCIDADDCTVTGQSCNANVCECPAGDVIENGECVTPTTSFCGDGTCDSDEDFASCPEDCDSTTEPPGQLCGNGQLDPGEECDGGELCRDDCTLYLNSGGGGGGRCSSTSGGAGLLGALFLALGVVATRRRRDKR